MKKMVVVAALVLAYQAQAQTNQSANVQAAPAAEPVVVQAQPAAEPSIAPGQASGNPIYILNSQRQGVAQQAKQNAIQEQPVSVVQDTPLKVSAAEQMRKHRQDSEAQTEDGIVQALEKARIEDEMRRRDKFNNAIAPVAAAAAGAAVNGDNNTVQQTQVVQQVAPVKMAPPVQKIAMADEADEAPAAKKSEEKVDIRNEIRSAIAESTKKDEEKPMSYIAAIASFGTYDGIRNVDNSMGYGVAIGTVTPERWVAEGSFTYGRFQMEDVYAGMNNSIMTGGYYPILVNMNQYNFAGAAKYQILPGRFRPTAGALLSYTRRMYSYTGYDTFRTTDALDVGATVGADLQVTNGFAVGVDFRYMTNLGYRSENNNQSFVYQQRRNAPEKLDYYSLNLLGKFTF